MELWRSGQQAYDWKSDPDMLVPGDIIDIDLCDDSVIFTPQQLGQLDTDLRALRSAREGTLDDEENGYEPIAG